MPDIDRDDDFNGIGARVGDEGLKYREELYGGSRRKDAVLHDGVWSYVPICFDFPVLVKLLPNQGAGAMRGISFEYPLFDRRYDVCLVVYLYAIK